MMPLFEELDALTRPFMQESWKNARDAEFMACMRTKGCDNAKTRKWRGDLAALEAFVAAHPELPENMKEVVPLIREFVLSHVRGEGAEVPFQRAWHILLTR